MTHDVASLKVSAIGGFLEHQIFGEMRVVVADVQTRKEDLLRPAVAVGPEHAQAPQLIVRERIGGAGIAPRHVPRVLGEHRAAVLVCNLPREHRLVERRELVRLFEVGGKIHVSRQLHRPVIRRFDTAVARQRVDEELLRSVRVHHAQADWQHELRRLVRDLQRSQIREAQPGVLGEVHLGNEEAHVLPQITSDHLRRAGWNPVAVLAEPRLEARALLRRQNQDVVFADGVLCLNRHAQRFGVP